MLTEDYRPYRIDSILGQDHVKPRLREYVTRDEVPNLLFTGDPGIGKTTAAIAIANEFYGEGWQQHFLELNASDDRGIDVVRERIKEFAKSGYDERGRMIFLDEADFLTSQAQAALRRTMESESATCSFILSCNYISKVIPAIQSRCAVFHFLPVPDGEIEAHLARIAKREDMEVTQSAIDNIVEYAEGDVRKAVTALDTLYIGETLDGEDILQILPMADREGVRKLLNLCSVGKFDMASELAESMIKEKGVTVRSILDEIHDVVWQTSLEDEQKVRILEQTGMADFAITEGASEHIQLDAMLARVVGETN